MPELIHGMPFAEYLALDRLSSSGLKILARSPAHFRHASAHPSESSPAQALGTHVHGLILEPEAYRYAVAPDADGRTKAGKEARAAFAAESVGAHVVTQDQHDKAQAMRDAVMSHPFASVLLADGRPEVTALWEVDEVACKARFDWLPDQFNVIVDLKTAADASREEFARAAGRYGYHIQDAWYGMGAMACGLADTGNPGIALRRPMVFIVVESEPPHAVALYMLDQEAIDAASSRIERLIHLYADCKHSGKWPGYSVEVETLSLPKWSL